MLTVYHNNDCSKSNAVVQLLEEKGIAFKFRYYLHEPLSEIELKELLDKLGLNAIDIVRKGEPVYKELFEGKELSNDEWIATLVAHPVLMERPIVETNDSAIVARPPETVLTML